MQPTSNDVHNNRPLTNVSVAYLQDPALFAADRVFPRVPVSKKTDSFYKYEKGMWLRDYAKERAPGTAAARGGFSLATDTYACKRFSFAAELPDEIRENADVPLDLAADKARFVSHILGLRREKQFITAAINTSIWGTDVDGDASTNRGTAKVKYWDASGSTPIADVRYYADQVQAATGLRPNVLVLSQDVFSALCDNADVLGRIQYTSPAFVTKEILARAFEVDEVVVMGGVENTAQEGASDSVSFLVSEKALLLYRPKSPGLLVPSAGYTFSWSQFDGDTMGARTKMFRDENTESWIIEGNIFCDFKVVGTDLGVYFSDLLT